jgi:2'-5' RNA ligase
MIRLFIPFSLDQPVKEGLSRIIKELKPLTRSVKWVDPINLHLTAYFLGDTDPKLVPVIAEILNQVAPQYEPINTTVDHLGGFPNLQRPRIIWVGMDQLSQKLIPIADEIRKGLAKRGVHGDDKPFKPHLTLGRVRDNQGLGQLLDRLSSMEFPPIPVRFSKIELIHSTLTSSGPIYKTLVSVPLGTRFE